MLYYDIRFVYVRLSFCLFEGGQLCCAIAIVSICVYLCNVPLANKD